MREVFGKGLRTIDSMPAKRETYTPDSLLKVAVEVFNERGYDGTSMEHLSQAAGISKSSIYHHVRGKEELLRRAISRALDGLFGILGERRAREGRAVDRLEYVTRRTVEVLLDELPYVTLLLRVRGNTDTEQWAMARRREFDQRVAELLRQAAADGDLRADVDARLATRLLFGMINSIVEWYRPQPASGRLEAFDGRNGGRDGLAIQGGDADDDRRRAASGGLAGVGGAPWVTGEAVGDSAEGSTPARASQGETDRNGEFGQAEQVGQAAQVGQAGQVGRAAQVGQAGQVEQVDQAGRAGQFSQAAVREEVAEAVVRTAFAGLRI